MRKINLSDFHIATSEVARDINRRIILNLIRTRQPISRADLARLTGLQRSTISDITEQLIAEQWITEGAFGKLPRGRNPRFLHLNSERAGIIGVNVRPNLTTLALTDLNARIIRQDSLATGSEVEFFLEDLARRIRSLCEAHPQIFIEGVGVGLPGRVDPETQRLVFAPNLSWCNGKIEESGGVEIKKYLEEATGLSVEVDNSANACAVFETWFGKHSEGVHDLIALTVSEGIGTGIIVNDQLIRGLSGLAGEFGHISLDENGPLCHCGHQGCWEVYASNTATIKYYSQLKGLSPVNNGTPAPMINDLLTLYESGDAEAVKAIDRTAHYLGVGIAMLITGFAPSLIVIVGEMTRVWDKIEPIINKAVAEKSVHSTHTRIMPLDELAQPRLRGAIMLVIQKHFVAPSVA